MELTIKVESEFPVQDAEMLQQFISEKYLDGIDEMELARAPHQPGQQGLGEFLGKLIVKISSGGFEEIVTTITSLISAISDFAVKLRRVVKIDGMEIPAHKLTGEQVEKLAMEYIKTKQVQG